MTKIQGQAPVLTVRKTNPSTKGHALHGLTITARGFCATRRCTMDKGCVWMVRNRSPVVTYGVNDMVLDNWGVVDRWTAEAKITSHDPSGYICSMRGRCSMFSNSG